MQRDENAIPQVMVNGIPQKMPTMVVERLLELDYKYEILPYTLVNDEISQKLFIVEKNGKKIILESLSSYPDGISMLGITTAYPQIVVVDFPQKGMEFKNAEFYCENAMPFIMSTTNKEPLDEIKERVRQTGNTAVLQYSAHLLDNSPQEDLHFNEIILPEIIHSLDFLNVAMTKRATIGKTYSMTEVAMISF